MRLPVLNLFRSGQTTMKQLVSSQWEERFDVLNDDVNLFCWKRGMDPDIHTYLEDAIDLDVDPVCHTINSKELKKQIGEIRSIWDAKVTSNSSLFWEDVYFLARDFLEFSPYKRGKLHLKVIKNDACAKFHIDGYRLRLFTTYYGKGTEWLPEDAVNRKALGTENKRIVKDSSRIQCMDTYDVSIMKGQMPGADEGIKGLVHRSPEIISEDGKRVILRIDI